MNFNVLQEASLSHMIGLSIASCGALGLLIAPSGILGFRGAVRIVTMASPSSDAQPSVAMLRESDCPVLKAWSTSQWVLQRLMSKNMLVIADKRLNREAVVLNRELLVPIINLVGNLASLKQSKLLVDVPEESSLPPLS